jgi:imidazolonepropionase
MTLSATPPRWDLLITGARIAAFERLTPRPYGAIDADAVGIAGGRIAWLGASADAGAAGTASEHIDAGGQWLTPGLIDCHTHLVYAGSRASEFEMRRKGFSYETIARAGGGVLSTVADTRGVSEAGLMAQSWPRLRALMAEGVTTVEIKSGYGLNCDTEIKILRAARALGARHSVNVRTTFLGAHALPEEYEGRAEAYIDLVCQEILPAVARENLADAVDAYCETVGFSVAQTARVFDCARGLGLPVKLHAEQLSNMGAAALAARYQALSADHLEYLDEAGAMAMARSGTVAVLLPGAFYFLRETQVPPVELLRRHGVPIAISSDLNPGTSPFASLLLMLNMACTLFRLTPEEAWAGVTCHAAAALGLRATHGGIALGKVADLALWNVPHLGELCYGFGVHRPTHVVAGGKLRGPVDSPAA